MTDIVADTLQHIRQLLIAQASLSEVAGSIYLEWPRTQTGAVPAPAIVWEVQANRPGPTHSPTMQISLKCTVLSRKNSADALALYRQAWNAIDNVRLHSGVSSGGVRVNKTSGYANHTNGPTTGYLKDLDLWYATGLYTAFMVENPT